jgi:uncharacterized membrane protein YheB (UPF0754 family)
VALKAVGSRPITLPLNKTLTVNVSVLFLQNKSLKMTAAQIGIWVGIPVFSAFFHWLTIKLALKLLFHPKQPVNIFGYKLQGVFPKRQKQFANSLGQLVSQELLSFEDIAGKVTNPESIKSVMPIVEEKIDHFLKTKLSEALPVISMFIGDKTINKVKEVFMEELNTIFPQLMNQYVSNLKNDLDLEKIVVDKVNGFSSDKLEEILQKIMNKEFRFVEIIGGVLGLLIGIVQVLISHYSKGV